MYRITVEKEENGVYTKVEDACLETTGYSLLAKSADGEGDFCSHVINLSRGDLLNMLLNTSTFVEVITMALPVLPMAIKDMQNKKEHLPPEIDAEELFNNPFPKNSGGG